jgi:prevent-host-death family protein
MTRKTVPHKTLVREIPQRELRNDVSRVLAEVEAGARFRITVNGRAVAELLPASSRRTWVPREDFLAILREAPLDRNFFRDVDGAVDQSPEPR